MGGDEIGDARGDVGPEARAVEDAVVADVGGEVMLAHVRGQRRRQVVGSPGVAEPGDVVMLALDGEHRDLGDCAGIDLLPAVNHLALGQRVLFEHCRSIVCR